MNPDLIIHNAKIYTVDDTIALGGGGGLSTTAVSSPSAPTKKSSPWLVPTQKSLTQTAVYSCPVSSIPTFTFCK